MLGMNDISQTPRLTNWVSHFWCRPSWSSLSQPMSSRVRLVAASTAPPIIHRQVLSGGTGILPTFANPGAADSQQAPTSTTAAPRPPAAQAVVSADAEAFAAAGGRMTSWEWQQLQRFRDAVAECRNVPEASPLLLEAGQLAGHSLMSRDPGLTFAVKQAVMTPHKRLMDSICRFAFPATHGLLTAGWQLRTEAEQPARGSTAGQAPAPSVQQPQQQQQQVQEQQQQEEEVAQALPAQPAQEQQPSVFMPLPAPPVQPLQQQQQLGNTEFAAHARSNSGSDHGSSGGALQQQQQGQAQPARLSRLGSTSGAAAAAPQQQQQQQPAPAVAAAGPATAALQLRVQAAAGAAALRGSSGQDAAQQAPSSNSMSWGSAAGSDMTAAHGMQQHQLAGSQPQQSWGTGVGSPQVHQLRSDDASSDGHQAQQTRQQQPALEGAAGSIAAAADGGAGGANLSWGTCSEAGAPQTAVAVRGVLDLPAAWQPRSTNSSSRVDEQAAASTAGASGSATHIAAATAQAAPLDTPPEQGAASIPPSTAVAGVSSGGSSRSGSRSALSALQRALVEDFVLYEEASAARQHVVGILVAVEQGDAAAGQRLIAPASAELIAATAPAAVPNRLGPHLNTPPVLAAAAAARAGGCAAGDVAAAAAVAAAEEYCRQTRGINRLLGSASSSRAALEASPKQAQQQRQQQQQLIVRALQQVSTRVPWLSRLLTPLQHSMAAEPSPSSTAVGEPPQDGAAAAAASTGGNTAPADGAAPTTQQQEQQQLAAPDADADAGQQELQAAVVELIMTLPELLHGLPGPALLTHEQFKQRHTQAQQLAAHAMQLLLPPATAAADDNGAVITAADGVAAELAASGLLAASAAAMAASHPLPAGGAGGGGGVHHNSHAGRLFANILDSLRNPAHNAAAGSEQPVSEADAAALSAAYGAARGTATGFLSRTAAFAAANRLADGLIRPPANTAPAAASIGLSRAASLAGAGQLGAWRLPAGAGGGGGAAGAAAAAAAAAAAGLGGFPAGTPAGAVGALGLGAFAPTGTGALLSGGFLAEGGVAGDSILDDMLHGNVRRITCHGLYELCAALAQPTGGGSPPCAGAAAAGGQHHQHHQAAGGSDTPPGGVFGRAAHSHMETDDSSYSSEGRVATGVAEAVATVAAAAAAIESRRRSSNHSMGPPPAVALLSGTKRRLSTSPDEQERPLKH